MSVRVQCPQCGKSLLASDERIGRNAVCPGCRSRFPIRAEDAVHQPDPLDDDDSGADAPLLPGAGGEEKYQDLVDMTAMVDIVFFLLIFFMITTASGIISCIGIPAPKQDGAATTAKRSSDLDQDTEVVTVRIDEQNRVWIDEIEFPTEADLRERLRAAKAPPTNAKKLHVKGHGNAHNGTLVMVLDLGSVLEFEPLMLSIPKEEEPQ